MSAKISYALEFQGLDKQIRDLKTINALLASIGQKSATLNVANAVHGGSSGGGLNLASIVPFSSNRGASSIATGAGAAIGARVGQWQGPLLKAGGIAPPESFLKQGAKRLSELGPLFPQEKAGGIAPPDWFLKQGAKRAMEMGPLFPPSVGSKIVGKLSGFLTKLGPIGIAVAGVTAGMVAMKKAIEVLNEGIKITSEAYRDAARSGLNPEVAQRIGNAFKILGLNTPNLSQFSYMLGHGNDTNNLLMLARTGQLGDEGRAILNMGEDFKRAMQQAEEAAKATKDASYIGFKLSMDEAQIGLQFKRLLSDIIADVGPMLHQLLQAVVKVLEAADALYEWLKSKGITLSNVAIGALEAQFPSMTGVFEALKAAAQADNGKPPGNNKPFFYNGTTQPQFTSLERLGFVMNGPKGFNPERNLAEINKNTAKAANHLGILVNTLSRGSFGDPLMHLPNLP